MIYKECKNTKLIEPCLEFIEDSKCLNMLWYMIQLGIFKLDSIDLKSIFLQVFKIVNTEIACPVTVITSLS